MKNVRIILFSVFLLIWQVYIPVHSACTEVEHMDDINMLCCSEDSNCNCCCSHDFYTGNKSKCGECSVVDDDINSKEFELTKQIKNITTYQEESNQINFDFKIKKFKLYKTNRVIFPGKPIILKSSLLI